MPIEHDLTPEELRFLIQRTPRKKSAWRCIGIGSSEELVNSVVEHDGERITHAQAEHVVSYASVPRPRREATSAEIVRAVYQATKLEYEPRREANKFKRWTATWNAKAHLQAYVIDRNPDHIFNAVAEFTKRKLPLSAVMLRNLNKAIAERHKTPDGNPKRTTLRDVWVLRSILRRYGGEIPRRIEGEFLAELAKQYGISVPALKMVVTRIRATLNRR